MKGFCVLVLSAVLTVGGIFGAGWVGLTVYRTFATRFESARTDVYRNNKSYVEGTIRDLRRLRVEYENASPEHKAALKTLIFQRANELDWDYLPTDIRRFLDSITC